MNVNMQATDPGEVKITAEITMPLKEWMKLQEALPEEHPFYKLSLKISEMQMDVAKTFYPHSIFSE
jgi:hypothetical protein